MMMIIFSYNNNNQQIEKSTMTIKTILSMFRVKVKPEHIYCIKVRVVGFIYFVV